MRRIARVVPTLASALQHNSALDLAGWRSQTRGLFQDHACTISMETADAISTFSFSPDPKKAGSLSATYRARYPSTPPEATISLEQQLDTLHWVFDTLCGTGSDMQLHVGLSCRNLVERLRRANSFEQSVYGTILLPRLFDDLDAFFLNGTYGSALLRQNHPDGWYSTGSPASADFDRAVSCAQATELQDLKTKMSARPQEKGDGKTKGKGDASRDSMKREREQPLLANVCGRVVFDNKEGPCGRRGCTREHKFPEGTSDADKATAKRRLENLKSKYKRSRAGEAIS